jgi:hypothetical protein
MIAEFSVFISIVYLIIYGLRYITDGQTQNEHLAQNNRGVAFNDDEDSFSTSNHSFSTSTTNPANGLPMMGGVDIEGNAYGTDSSHWDDH